VDATVTIKNVGTQPSDEVVQLYINKPSTRPADAMFAESVLGGFERTRLAAGESKVVLIHSPLRVFQYWSPSRNAWVTPIGGRTVWVGESSRDVQLKDTISLVDDNASKTGER
jgi:beta-glucosidase